MGLSRAQLKQRAEQRLTEYLTTHGTKLDDSLIIWNKEPICVKDICVLSAVIENGVVVFCDYNIETRSYDKLSMILGKKGSQINESNLYE